ncbi:MAG: iron ABC transporter permease [Acidobacteria bacterium]|nr:iron ABC transporter permease [Acidobacteriota bacterium]
MLAAPPLVFLTLFFLWPVLAILERGLRPAGRVDLGVVVDVLTDPTVARVAWFTLWESALSTIACIVIGLPGAALFARVAFRGRRTLWSLLLVPFVMPTVVVATAFIVLIGPSGVTGVSLTGTIWAILIAHVFFNYAVVVRTVGAAWMTLDDRTVEAARTLGASPVRAFLSVTLPQLRAAIAAAASVVFLFSFTSFGVVLLLGGVRQRTLEVEIYDQTARFLHLDVAAVLAILQLIGVVLVLVLLGRLRSGHGRSGTAVVGADLRAGREQLRPPASLGARLFLLINLAVMGAVLAAPLVVLVIRSLSTAQGWGFAAYRALGSARRGSTAFIDPTDALGNSLRFATVTMILAVLLGACGAWAIAGRGTPRGRSNGGRGPRFGGAAELALMVPLGASAVTVGFGCLIALDRPPLDLRTSWWMLPIAHTVIALPFVISVLVPGIRSVDGRLLDAAASLGASRLGVWWRVELPLVRRSLLVAAGFAFAISLGEFGATAFLVRADDPTLPIAIGRALGRPGGDSFSQALALSVILLVVTAVVVLAVDRLRPIRGAEF